MNLAPATDALGTWTPARRNAALLVPMGPKAAGMALSIAQEARPEPTP